MSKLYFSDYIDAMTKAKGVFSLWHLLIMAGIYEARHLMMTEETITYEIAAIRKFLDDMENRHE